MKVVIDTNVLVSRFLSPKGPPAEIFARWESHAFELLVSEPILAEYHRVLQYPHLSERHGMSTAAIVELVAALRQVAILVTPTEQLDVIAADPADNMFLECAVAGDAAYIVSGDAHLLRLGAYQGISILTPSAFLAVVAAI